MAYMKTAVLRWYGRMRLSFTLTIDFGRCVVESSWIRTQLGLNSKSDEYQTSYEDAHVTAISSNHLDEVTTPLKGCFAGSVRSLYV